MFSCNCSQTVAQIFQHLISAYARNKLVSLVFGDIQNVLFQTHKEVHMYLSEKKYWLCVMVPFRTSGPMFKIKLCHLYVVISKVAIFQINKEFSMNIFTWTGSFWATGLSDTVWVYRQEKVAAFGIFVISKIYTLKHNRNYPYTFSVVNVVME